MKQIEMTIALHPVKTNPNVIVGAALLRMRRKAPVAALITRDHAMTVILKGVELAGIGTPNIAFVLLLLNRLAHQIPTAIKARQNMHKMTRSVSVSPGG